jgi:NAD(P)-dependent dehydrogenase (short-subunit alcohol dehydrogenase family)
MEGKMIQAKTEPWGRILNGRVAVVTGAARGIGRAAAAALAHSGAHVVGIDICAVVDPRSGVEPANRAELDQTGEMVKSADVQWRSFVLDQRDLPALRTVAEKTNTEFGHIDILFANAGIQAFRPLLRWKTLTGTSRSTSI